MVLVGDVSALVGIIVGMTLGMTLGKLDCNDVRMTVGIQLRTLMGIADGTIVGTLSATTKLGIH